MRKLDISPDCIISQTVLVYIGVNTFKSFQYNFNLKDAYNDIRLRNDFLIKDSVHLGGYVGHIGHMI